MVNSSRPHCPDLSSSRVKYFRRVTLEIILSSRDYVILTYFRKCRAPINLSPARIGPPSPVWIPPIRVQFPPARFGLVVVDQPGMGPPDPGYVPFFTLSGKRGGGRGLGSGYSGFGVSTQPELGVAHHSQITDENYGVRPQMTPLSVPTNIYLMVLRTLGS